MIGGRCMVDAEARQDDFDETLFAERGGLGKAWSLFGEEPDGIVDELNRVVAA